MYTHVYTFFSFVALKQFTPPKSEVIYRQKAKFIHFQFIDDLDIICYKFYLRFYAITCF